MQGEQYAGERATYDNACIIGKGGSPSPSSPRRTYCPRLWRGVRPLCGRRGNDALLGRGGQARRRAVRWPQGNRPCCPVRQQADSPAYCRLPVGANLHLLALSRGLPYRATAQLGDNVETIEGTSSGERRYKARPCGPTNRAAAAAGRRDRRARRWGERPPVLPAHSRRKAGLAAAHGRYLAV